MATIIELEKEVKKLRSEVDEFRAHIGLGEVHILSPEERKEVRKGLSDRLATDEEVEAVLSKYGLQSTL